MPDLERKDIRLAMLYELRLLLKASQKEQYTKAELTDFLDHLAAEECSGK